MKLSDKAARLAFSPAFPTPGGDGMATIEYVATAIIAGMFAKPDRKGEDPYRLEDIVSDAIMAAEMLLEKIAKRHSEARYTQERTDTTPDPFA